MTQPCLQNLTQLATRSPKSRWLLEGQLNSGPGRHFQTSVDKGLCDRLWPLLHSGRGLDCLALCKVGQRLCSSSESPHRFGQAVDRGVQVDAGCLGVLVTKHSLNVVQRPALFEEPAAGLVPQVMEVQVLDISGPTGLQPRLLGVGAKWEAWNHTASMLPDSLLVFRDHSDSMLQASFVRHYGGPAQLPHSRGVLARALHNVLGD